LGFKRSGQAFTMPSETHFVMLGLQKSTSSSADLVRFTINVSVISRQIWAQVREKRSHLPATPSPNTFYGDFAWQERIGTLLDGTDRWWTIRTGKIRGALRRPFLMPFDAPLFRRSTTTSGVRVGVKGCER
jgi:hypothetical protein